MEPAFQIDSGFLTAMYASLAFMVLMPIVLVVLAWRLLRVSPVYAAFGALVFVVAQILIRIPLITVLQVFVGPSLAGAVAAQVASGAFLAFTAGLFESVGRYAGYRWLMRRDRKTWAQGVMYGLGHGGIESMLLTGGLVAIQIVTLTSLTSAQVAALPAEGRAALEAQVTAMNTLPAWIGLAGSYERLWTVVFHVAMSVLVLQVFRRGQLRWLWYAVAAHTTVDFVVAVLTRVLVPEPIAFTLLSEGLLTVFGLISLGVIWVLRDRGPEEGEQGAGSGERAPAAPAPPTAQPPARIP